MSSGGVSRQETSPAGLETVPSRLQRSVLSSVGLLSLCLRSFPHLCSFQSGKEYFESSERNVRVLWLWSASAFFFGQKILHGKISVSRSWFSFKDNLSCDILSPDSLEVRSFGHTGTDFCERHWVQEKKLISAIFSTAKWGIGRSHTQSQCLKHSKTPPSLLFFSHFAKKKPSPRRLNHIWFWLLIHFVLLSSWNLGSFSQGFCFLLCLYLFRTVALLLCLSLSASGKQDPGRNHWTILARLRYFPTLTLYVTAKNSKIIRIAADWCYFWNRPRQTGK